jgi:hypothetical protein
MNNKAIIKSYEEACNLLKKDKSEDAKQKFLIIFKELDLQLNKELEERIEKLEATAPNLREEINRIEGILSLIKYRCESRTKMVNDYKMYIGYEPVDLVEVPHLEDEKDYVAYKTNLIVANEIVTDLIKSGKRVSSLKEQLKKRGKNKIQIQKEIEELQNERGEKLETLKTNSGVLDDLYDYCLTAPFNEENAYIEYLMIKLNPSGILKINLKKTPKRTVKKHEVEADTRPLEEMPIVPSIGSVRPNNMLKYMEETALQFDDVTIPSNGLIDNNSAVKVNAKNIEKK